MGVLLDLDLTLVNSLVAEPLRRARRWQEVYGLIKQFNSYDGIAELIVELSDRRVPVCIVTSSPESYCTRVLNYFQWGGVQTVCYHDTHKHKPDPEPILLGLSKLGVNASEAISVGDDPKDIIASRAACVRSVGALWGTRHRASLINSRPDVLCETVNDLRKVLLTKYSAKS